MLSHALCAFIAPALAAAAAFPWALPEPTFAIPEIDSWSPAPTKAPNAGGFDLFRRADQIDTLCGYLSAISTSLLTCPPGKSSACATNTHDGVHGCCDPNDMPACSIPTTCIPSSLMSASCTNSICSSNLKIAKCTETAAPECYQWNFVYSSAKTTTFTEWGCAAKPGTAMVERTWSGMSTPTTSSSSTRTSSTTSSSSEAASVTVLPATQDMSKPNNTAAIVGGTIGGLVVVGAVASFIIYLFLHDRRLKREASGTHQSRPAGDDNNPGVKEYDHIGFAPVNAWHDDNKGWAGSPTETLVNKSPVISDCGPGGYDNGATLFGIVEAHGQQVHEAPA
ncbi:hypothetical protein P280DRAFT_468146 [Massarina eburnea CBS 473.64]|uniref:Mid2 domain-containing protein n=1 Tax=Massarina eburnea CBS 473.64 TaxID=1395130 RepID=A0A6A6S6F3_9PLEO|nr:hypothetical protein P280DRAFT_468146 [Massarina eburnea CBS 473.64]